MNLPFSGRTISDFTYFRIGISAVNHPGKPEIPARLVFLYAQHYMLAVKIPKSDALILVPGMFHFFGGFGKN